MSTIASIDTEVQQKLGAEQISAAAVVERMKECWSCKTDTELAERLRTSKGNVSRWKSRNSIPYVEAVFTSVIRVCSLDYILTGRGEAREASFGTYETSHLDSELISRIVYSLYSFGLFDLPKDADEKERLSMMTRGIVFQYDRGIELIARLTKEDGLSEDVAKKAALAGMELSFSNGDLFGPRFRTMRAKQGPQ